MTASLFRAVRYRPPSRLRRFWLALDGRLRGHDGWGPSWFPRNGRPDGILRCGSIAFFRRLNRRDDGGRSSRLSFVMAAQAAVHGLIVARAQLGTLKAMRHQWDREDRRRGQLFISARMARATSPARSSISCGISQAIGMLACFSWKARISHLYFSSASDA